MSFSLKTVLILSISIIQAIDSTNIFHPVSADINPKLFSAKIPAQKYLSPVSQAIVKPNSVDCPFDNGIYSAKAWKLELHCSFFLDEACKKQVVKAIVTWIVEPTSNKNVTLLRSMDILVEETSVADQFFYNNFFTIPMLLFLAQKIETPYLLPYIIDPVNKNLRKPVLIEMPHWQKSKEYYDVYHNLGYFSFNPSNRKQFAHEPIVFSPGYIKAMGLEPKSTLYADFHRVGVNRLISHYNLK